MIDNSAKVPSPSAAGWLVDLASVEGPCFVVLCRSYREALLILRDHLVEIGAVESTCAAEHLLRHIEPEPIGVVW